MPNKSVKKRNAREKETSQKPLAPNKLLLFGNGGATSQGGVFPGFAAIFRSKPSNGSVGIRYGKQFRLAQFRQGKTGVVQRYSSGHGATSPARVEKKFSTIRGGKGIAFTIPMTSTGGRCRV